MKPRLDPTPPAAEVSTAAPSTTGPEAAAERARRKDRILGLVIVAVAFAICMALSIWAKEKSDPETSEPPAPPTLEGLQGFPKAVDPIASLPLARKLTRRTHLRGIVIDGAKNEGTIDVSEGVGRVRYVFQSPAGHGPQPPLEPGTLRKRVTCGKQNVVVRKEGLVAETDVADYPCPPAGVEPLPEPQCGVRDIWRIARKRRVPKDRTARIEYYRAKAGPAWRFELTSTTQPHRFTVYGDCKRELSGVEAQGTVP